MKKLLLAAMLFSLALTVHAQEEDINIGGFKKENLFTGGNLNVSFFNNTTSLGVSPYFGYSITKWLDAALSFNFSYISQRDYYDDGKLRQTILAPGAFVRVFPINFLFAQAQLEHNFLTIKDIPPSNSGNQTLKYKADVNSLLLGIGYSSGREEGSNTYYYVSLSFDVLQKEHSPYLDNQQRILPILNAGFNIGLFQGRGRGRERERRD